MHRMDRCAERLLRTAQHRFAGEHPCIILIDGRSGSGKTQLSRSLLRAFSPTGAGILPVEDLYPGWDGLAVGANAVADALTAGAYRRYDWHQGVFADTVHLDVRRPLILEGCGALSRESVRAAAQWGSGRVWTVWTECPDEIRCVRALGRDGEMFRPHWDQWARQEDDLFDRVRPVAHAHQIVHTGTGVDGAPEERG